MADDKKASFEDQAAKTYSELVPIWKRLRGTLSSKAKDRVMDAIMQWPLQDEAPKFQSGKEMELFKLGCTILDCKTIMVSAVFEERMKREKEKETAFKPQVTEGFEIKGD